MTHLCFLATADGIKLDLVNLDTLNAGHEQRDDVLIDASHAYSKRSQHVQYATHFPIPQENFTSHECNQRLVLLYGVGKARNEVIANSKGVMKDLCCMLTSLGSCLDPGGNSENSQSEEQRAALYK